MTRSVEPIGISLIPSRPRGPSPKLIGEVGAAVAGSGLLSDSDAESSRHCDTVTNK